MNKLLLVIVILFSSDAYAMNDVSRGLLGWIVYLTFAIPLFGSKIADFFSNRLGNHAIGFYMSAFIIISVGIILIH